MTCGLNPDKVSESEILAREAHILLMWLALRKAGLVAMISAQHTDLLYAVRDPGAAFEWLLKKGWASEFAPGVEWTISEAGLFALVRM
jgi:hypothetical protein